MALNDFTGQNIKDTYQKVVQTDGTNLTDGTGSLLPISFDGNNVTISGSLIAKEYIISSSVTSIQIATLSGSTEFGNTQDDVHQFTGNITASGNISASGFIISKQIYGQSGLGGNNINMGSSNRIDINPSNTVAIRLTDSLVTLNKDTKITGNITASGNIHSSNISLTGHITASGNISASGEINADRLVCFSTNLGSPESEDDPLITLLGADGTHTINSLGIFSGTSLTATIATNFNPAVDQILNNNIKIKGKETGGAQPSRNMLYMGSDNVVQIGATLNPTSLRSNGAIHLTGSLYGSGYDIAEIRHITTSGDISASGDVYASNIILPSDGEIAPSTNQGTIKFMTKPPGTTDNGERFTIGEDLIEFQGGQGVGQYSLLQMDMTDGSETVIFNASSHDVDFAINSDNGPAFVLNAENDMMAFRDHVGIGYNGDKWPTSNYGVAGTPDKQLMVSGLTHLTGSVEIIGPITTHITASGNISASGDLYASHIHLSSPGISEMTVGTSFTVGNALEIVGNINASGDLLFGGAILNDITASGNISASGNIILSQSLTFGAAAAEIISPTGLQIKGANANEFINLTDNFVQIFMDGSECLGVSSDGSNNGQIILNASSHNMDTKIVYDNGTPGFFLDANKNRIKLRDYVTIGSGSTPNGDPNALYVSGSQYNSSHITSSGNIRVSGSTTTAINLDTSGHITASGDISASGDLYASHIELNPPGIDVDGSSNGMAVGTTFRVGAALEIVGNINASGDLRFGGEILNDITASGDISASGEIYAADYYASGQKVRPNLYWFGVCDAVTTAANDSLGDFPETDVSVVSFNATTLTSDAAVFTLSGDEVTITRAGVYKFTYNVLLEIIAGSNRTEGAIGILRDRVVDSSSTISLIEGSRSSTYNRFNAAADSVSRGAGSVSMLIDVNVNDKFYIGFYKEAHHTTSTKLRTVPSGTTWTIEAVT